MELQPFCRVTDVTHTNISTYWPHQNFFRGGGCRKFVYKLTCKPFENIFTDRTKELGPDFETDGATFKIKC
jgi:hypothetical protein